MLYTRKGDTGTTKFFDTESGKRTPKNSARAEALGSLDELNSFLGFCKVKAQSAEETLRIRGKAVYDMLEDVQENLFIVQAELAGAEKALPADRTPAIEKIIDAVEEEVPPITGFSIAGGTELSALFDVARTVARRTERRVLAAVDANEGSIGDGARSYLNRLSSLLFALARYANHAAGVKEKNPSYK